MGFYFCQNFSLPIRWQHFPLWFIRQFLRCWWGRCVACICLDSHELDELLSVCFIAKRCCIPSVCTKSPSTILQCFKNDICLWSALILESFWLFYPLLLKSSVVKTNSAARPRHIAIYYIPCIEKARTVHACMTRTIFEQYYVEEDNQILINSRPSQSHQKPPCCPIATSSSVLLHWRQIPALGKMCRHLHSPSKHQQHTRWHDIAQQND